MHSEPHGFALCSRRGWSFWNGLKLFGNPFRCDSCLFPLVASLCCEKRQGAKQNHTAALWEEAGEAKSVCVPNYTHTHTHTHTELYFSVVMMVFSSLYKHHTFLQPNTIYIAKTDTIKWSWTWQALKEFVCLRMITCHNVFLNVFFSPPNYHKKHKVRKEILLLSLRNYNFNQKARRNVMNFTVQELNHDEIPNWTFKIVFSRTGGGCLVAKLCLTLRPHGL